MVCPAFIFSGCCYNKIDAYKDAFNAKNNKMEKQLTNVGKIIGYSTTAFDTVVSLTSLVIGILGALSIISMPPAAAYALIGISCLITIMWVALFITSLLVKQSGSENNSN